jgi:hypothetical protein
MVTNLSYNMAKANINDMVEEVRKKTNPTNKKTKQKKKKQIPKLSKNNIYIILGSIIVLIIIILLFFNQSYTYQINRSGINYYSNEFTPTESFNQLKNQETVYVSPLLEENNASVFFTNAMNLWQIVLIGNDINAIQLIRVEENNEFVYCYTNEGNVKESKQITVEECNQILNNEDNFKVLIEEGSSRVILENNKISVFSSEENSGITNFSVIREAFVNAQNILDIVNQKIYGIN